MPSPSPPRSLPADRQTEQQLLQALAADIDGAIVIASTERAARALRIRYDQWQQSSGNQGWITPQILDWEPWLQTLWDSTILSGTEARMLLNEVQELELWRKVLAGDESAKTTLSIDALAEASQRAWKQMHRYGIPLKRLRGDSSLDTTAFLRWAAEFEKLSRKLSCLSPALLETALVQSISSHEISLPQQVLLLGFDRTAPAQKLLLDTLDALGCRIHPIQLQSADSAAREQIIACARTREDEIESAARWIRQSLLKNPAHRIGVIVPALEEVRGTIDATFRRILVPGSIDIRAARRTLPYEFSLGSPMHRLAPVRTAIGLLRWLTRALPAEEISWLLVHGDFSDSSQVARESRAALDREFRERKFQLGGPLSLNSFRKWLSNAKGRQQTAPFCHSLDHLSIASGRNRVDKNRPFGEWREVIEDLLAAADWRLLAAERSADYQLQRRWNALLNDLSSLSGVADPVSFATVVAKLEHLAAHTLFSLETSGSPVQILGVPESAGLVFDSVWWMNAHVDAWPQRGKALPFLPWTLQRESHMPYADPVEDSAFALRVTERILDSASTIIVSFALEKGDAANASTHIPDRELVLSPMVRQALPDTPVIAAEDFVPENFSLPSAASSPRLEDVREEPFVPFQGDRIEGGVRFLALHAACPFRAFAEVRLAARPVDESVAGLSSRAQGTIAHHVLEKFWQEYQSQENLLTATIEQHRESLRAHIRRALIDFFHHAGEPWQEALLQIESDRLEQRLLLWLEQEKQRPAFSVIKTEDTLEHPRLGGIAFDCRIDRMDRVAEGAVLIDYKTGPVDRNSCNGERPDQPQLPAYAVLRGATAAAAEPLAGVAFAGLHPKRIGFTVVSSLPSVFAKDSQLQTATAVEPATGARSRFKRNEAALTPQEMESQQDEWRSILTRLAEDFRDGRAEVDPKKGDTTCAFCEQTLLCRIRETTLTAGNLAEEDCAEGPARRGIYEP